MQYPDGAHYTGGWFESDRSGEGVFTFADGAKYEGGWLKNIFHGKGKYTLANGKILHDGTYSHGKFVG